MKLDRAAFFAAYPAAFDKLTAEQSFALADILKLAEDDDAISDLRWLAYILATIKHECAGTWRPIEEYGHGAGHDYGKPVTLPDDPTPHVYYGRGYVQLTWSWNYSNLGAVLGVDLLHHPELALEPATAWRIISHGMRHGSFTGAGLARYINGDRCDYVNARRIVNGLDAAEKIAGYATKLEACLRAAVALTDAERAAILAGLDVAASVDVAPVHPEPDEPA